MDFSEAVVAEVITITLAALLGRSIRCALDLGKPEENQESVLPQTRASGFVDEKKAELVEP